MESGWEFGNGKRLGIDERVGRVVGSGFKAPRLLRVAGFGRGVDSDRPGRFYEASWCGAGGVLAGKCLLWERERGGQRGATLWL